MTPTQVNAYANKLTWAKRSFSDCLAILNAYNDWSRAHREACTYYVYSKVGPGGPQKAHKRK